MCGVCVFVFWCHERLSRQGAKDPTTSEPPPWLVAAHADGVVGVHVHHRIRLGAGVDTQRGVMSVCQDRGQKIPLRASPLPGWSRSMPTGWVCACMRACTRTCAPEDEDTVPTHLQGLFSHRGLGLLAQRRRLAIVRPVGGREDRVVMHLASRRSIFPPRLGRGVVLLVQHLCVETRAVCKR